MLITLLVVIIVVALALYAVSLIPMDGRLSVALQVVIVIIAIIWIAHAFGLG